MYSIKFEPVGLEGIVKNVKTRGFFKTYISEAVESGLFEIEKRTNDSESNGEPYFFNFKALRGDRTGFLAVTFQNVISYEASNLAFQGDRIEATTFSPMIYADRVASKNDFYGRIYKNAKPKIDRHFDKAVDKAMNDLGLSKN